MYYKIVRIGDEKYEKMGMVEVTAAFYLEPGDEGYDKYISEHLVEVPIIPEEGYPGKMTKDGIPQPVDMNDYEKWVKSLPTFQHLNPFCYHSIQFEADVTEEEILWCFEWALAITHQNYLIDDLQCIKGGQIVNEPFGYLSRKKFYEGVSLIPENKRSDYMKKEIAKIKKASQKTASLKNVDWAKIKTIAKYSVK